MYTWVKGQRVEGAAPPHAEASRPYSNKPWGSRWGAFDVTLKITHKTAPQHAESNTVSYSFCGVDSKNTVFCTSSQKMICERFVAFLLSTTVCEVLYYYKNWHKDMIYLFLWTGYNYLFNSQPIFNIILCPILISRLVSWPVTEENAQMTQMFSATSVFYYIQTATENYRFCEKSLL